MDPTLLRKDDFIDIGQFVCPTLEQEMWLTWSGTEDAKALGMKAHEPSDVVLNGHHFVAKQGTYQQIRDTVSAEFKNGTFELAEKILQIAESLCKECEMMAHAASGTSTHEELERMFALMKRLRFPWMACMPIGDAGEEWIQTYAKERGLDADAVARMVPDLPNSVIADQQRLFSFKQKTEAEGLPFEIGELKRVAPALASEIEAYQKETKHVGTHHFWGSERTIGVLMDAIRHALPSASSAAPVPDVSQFMLIARAAKWRLECAEASSLLGYAYKPYLTHIASACGMSYVDLVFLTTDEIERVSHECPDFSQQIRMRQRAFGMYSKQGRINMLVESELTPWMKHFGLLKTYEGIHTLRGSTGNKGKATGVVVVIREPSDLAKTKDGMILVATSTTPDFISAMSKSAAFVTDQGGITSHAAIVARELGKPCIIGTKFATRVLKDGDLVEVDAEKGVVRKI